MDQAKIGRFLQELRKEQGLTQEQLAERLYVARRTVSRWETGSNLPDLDVLVELADLYDVELRELLDGERKGGEMDKETQETVMKVAEYSSEQQRRTARKMCIFFAVGIIALVVNLLADNLGSAVPFDIEFVKGLTLGFATGVMILGILFATGAMAKTQAFKMRMLHREG